MKPFLKNYFASRVSHSIGRGTLHVITTLILLPLYVTSFGQVSSNIANTDSLSAVVDGVISRADDGTNQISPDNFSPCTTGKTVISDGEFNKGFILNPEGLIAGRFQGLRARLADGSPSAGWSLGSLSNSTFNSSLTPLLLVDGVPVSAIPLLLNPQEIESITWLHGGQAAEYGSLGRNGALLITTKKGKPGLHVTYSGQVAISTVKKYGVLTGDQVREALLEMYADDPDILNRAGNANTDWQDEIYRTAVSHDHHLGVSGSVANVPFRFSAGQTLAQGTIRSSYYRKTSFTGRIDPSLLDERLNISLAASANLANQSSPGGLNLPYYAAMADPTAPVYVNNDPAQGYTTGSMFLNPVAMIDNNDYLNNPEQFAVNMTADYRLQMIPGLRIGLMGAALGYADETKEIIVPGGGMPIINGWITTLSESLKVRMLEFSAGYSIPVEKIDGNLDLKAGYFTHWRGRETSDLTTDFTDPEMIYEKYRSTSESARRSVYGKADFSAMGRYFLTAVLRNDGFSEFSPDNRNVLSPSVTAEWNIAGEPFFPSGGLVNELTLSLTLGTAGTGSMTRSFSAMPSPDIKPETTTYFIPGLRMTMFENRLTLSLNGFINKNRDILTEQIVPTGTNYSNTILVNGGDLDNRGVELRVDASLFSGEKIEWRAAFNMTVRKNIIESLPTGIEFISAGSVPLIPFAQVLVQDSDNPVNTFYLLKQVYDDDRMPIQGLYEDTNNNGSFGFDDRYTGPSTDPEFAAGIWSSLRYGDWELSLSASSLAGNWCYNVESAYGNYGSITPSNTLRNISSLVYESGFTAMVPYSDYHMENGSFIRLDFISLGHTFRNVAGKNIDISLGATVQNAFMLTAYRGADPDNEAGLTGYTWPKPRTASLSLNIGF